MAVDANRRSLFTTIPPQLSHGKPGHLNTYQLKEFFDKGFVLVKDFFDRVLLEKVKADISLSVDALAQKLYAAKKIKSLYEEEGLYQRLTKLEGDFPGANILLHKAGVFPLSFQQVWADEKLLNVAEQVLGTADITGNPVWNLRCKTPNTQATIVPWHQDTAYMDYGDCDKMVFSAWIPLLDTDENNGGMEMMARAHHKAEVFNHTCCFGNTWYIEIPEDELKNKLKCIPGVETVKMCVPYGGVLLFNNMTPHRSLPNTSNDVRWSLDLRFNREDVPVGFWGVKDGVKLRSSTDPNMKIDWDTFNAVDRNETQALNKEANDFDTTISGPWMTRWEMTHQNRHTESMSTDTAKIMPSVIG